MKHKKLKKKTPKMGNEININLYAVEGISHINFIYILYSFSFKFFSLLSLALFNDNDKRVWELCSSMGFFYFGQQ